MEDRDKKTRERKFISPANERRRYIYLDYNHFNKFHVYKAKEGINLLDPFTSFLQIKIYCHFIFILAILVRNEKEMKPFFFSGRKKNK